VRFIETELKNVILVEPDVHGDQRGYFFELYHERKFSKGGITSRFVQDNYSQSVRGTLRGLHYQLKKPQGKLIVVVEGTIFDIVLDIRKGSPTFRKWYGIELSSENKRQLYVPPGFARTSINPRMSAELSGMIERSAFHGPLRTPCFL